MHQSSAPDGSRVTRTRVLLASVRREIPMLTEDRRIDRDVAWVLARLRADELPIGTLEPVTPA